MNPYTPTRVEAAHAGPETEPPAELHPLLPFNEVLLKSFLEGFIRDVLRPQLHRESIPESRPDPPDRLPGMIS